MSNVKDYFLGGEHQDFIGWHKAQSLDRALAYIRSPSGVQARHYVHVFPDVLATVEPPEVGRQFESLLHNPRIDFMAQSLRHTSVEGLFINDKDIGGIKSTQTAKIAAHLKGCQLTEGPLLSLKDSEAFMTNSLSDIAAHRAIPIYGMNISADNTRLATFLATVPLNINSARNPHIGCLAGINVPTYHLAGRLAFSEIHVEHGYLDSCDLMHWGEQGAEKLWLFIQPSFNWTLCCLVMQRLKEVRGRGEDVTFCDVECPTPMHHKTIALTPAFLKANGIPYQVIAQRPGTLMYIREGVYHQILSTALNLSEAVNVGGGGWNHQAHSFVSCRCPGRAVFNIARNPYSYETMRSHSTQSHRCSEPGCQNVAATAFTAHQHVRVHSRGAIKSSLFSCRLCPSVFVSETFLERHIIERHPVSKKDVQLCLKCNRVITSKNFARHRRRCTGPNGASVG